MTLINYVTRVHFGDGVLEEALWAEIERNGKSRPLILADKAALKGDMVERFFSGLPAKTGIEVFTDVPDIPNEETALVAADFYRSTDRDHLISFGGGKATDLAKIVRVLVRHDSGLATFASSEGGSLRIAKDLPDLFAIPGLSGFASAISSNAPVILKSAERIEVDSKQLIPTVTICDPTLTMGAAPEATASAGVAAIARCIEAFLSRSYHPPADGIALDGLTRAVGNIRRATEEDDLIARREMMAASLDGALAQEKGLGIAHAIINALETVAAAKIDAGAVGRLVLPGVLRFHADAAVTRYEPLRHILKIAPDRALADGLEELFSALPLPKRLARPRCRRRGYPRRGAARRARPFGSQQSAQGACRRHLLHHAFGAIAPGLALPPQPKRTLGGTTVEATPDRRRMAGDLPCQTQRQPVRYRRHHRPACRCRQGRSPGGHRGGRCRRTGLGTFDPAGPSRRPEAGPATRSWRAETRSAGSSPARKGRS